MSIFSQLFSSSASTQNYSFSVTGEEKNDLCTSVVNHSSIQPGFYFLLAVATFIVSVGLIKDSWPLLIGGMLVAPLLSPILFISLSLTILNSKVFLRSILVFILSAIASFIVSALIGVFTNVNIESIDVIKRINTFDLSTFLVPVVAGAAASYALAKKGLSDALPGVAVTVTLLPPLAAMGLTFVAGQYEMFSRSLLVYFLNVFGIILGSLIIFLLLGFHKSEKAVVKQVEISKHPVNN
ncbi:TIGR00341 family protein [Candidatus Falkowbacteria bacterium CG10_big_fil_rev_8_21_14_0_10_37_14]|uniref:TIGR00341 family protein n=1 Tax=Candidatus Falkowbacteria bacterium CG10_big_fil_rev_8_21_14_0_10_37_14 TaxID=1974561 RepID=A0A2M6WSH1_9BACT|nr:TIGR00341 family protein [Candidatus Falkowbacteria bacterium]PIT95721.1 MAG: TIGR00341 family protein [Candidatus Falkowbacteria bacterium CG10_big_fil_rev_8_21_14_0_10_37_14]